jgi:hypothetical protein
MSNINDRNVIISQTFETEQSKKAKSWKHCYIYLSIISGLIILSVINFLSTYDSFSDYKIIYIDPKVVCELHMNEYDNCKSLNKDNEYLAEICLNFSKSVRKCFDDIFKFNKICHTYISELDKCYRTSALCENQERDLKSCKVSNEVKIEFIYDYIKTIN